MSSPMAATLRTILLIARRDKLFIALLIAIVLAAAVSAGLGSAAIVEQVRLLSRRCRPTVGGPVDAAGVIAEPYQCSRDVRKLKPAAGSVTAGSSANSTSAHQRISTSTVLSCVP